MATQALCRARSTPFLAPGNRSCRSDWAPDPITRRLPNLPRRATPQTLRTLGIAHEMASRHTAKTGQPDATQEQPRRRRRGRTRMKFASPAALPNPDNVTMPTMNADSRATVRTSGKQHRRRSSPASNRLDGRTVRLDQVQVRSPRGARWVPARRSSCGAAVRPGIPRALRIRGPTHRRRSRHA